MSPAERQITQQFYRIVDEGRAALLGSVRQELLSGLREQSQFRRLRDYLRDFPDIPLVTEDYEEAAVASNECRRIGLASSPVDMLICAVSIHHGCEIFTTDADFAKYSTVLKIQLFSGA